jgi:hypothetical protein
LGRRNSGEDNLLFGDWQIAVYGNARRRLCIAPKSYRFFFLFFLDLVVFTDLPFNFLGAFLSVLALLALFFAFFTGAAATGSGLPTTNSVSDSIIVFFFATTPSSIRSASPARVGIDSQELRGIRPFKNTPKSGPDHDQKKKRASN